jgi:hypothetical protein
VQSAGLGGMEVSESSRITDSHPLEQSTQLQHADGTTSGNFLSSLGGLGLDAANSMLSLFQSSNELEGIPSCGVSRSAHQISKATSDLVHTPSLQVHHHQQHLHACSRWCWQLPSSANLGEVPVVNITLLHFFFLLVPSYSVME